MEDLISYALLEKKILVLLFFIQRRQTTKINKGIMDARVTILAIISVKTKRDYG